MDQTAMYLPKLCEWVDDRIIFWQSELGCSLVHGYKHNPTKSFSISVDRDQSVVKNDNGGSRRTGLEKTGSSKPGLVKPDRGKPGLIRPDAFFVKLQGILLFLIVRALKILI